MRVEHIGVLLLLTSWSAFAADTKSVNDVDGRCVASVPSSWSVSQAGAQSLDKAVSIVLISAAPSLGTLPEVRKHLLGIYQEDKLIKDSSSELGMQGTSFSGKPNFVRGDSGGWKSMHCRNCVRSRHVERRSTDH